jgi:hypothetical protein
MRCTTVRRTLAQPRAGIPKVGLLYSGAPSHNPLPTSLPSPRSTLYHDYYSWATFSAALADVSPRRIALSPRRTGYLWVVLACAPLAISGFVPSASAQPTPIVEGTFPFAHRWLPAAGALYDQTASSRESAITSQVDAIDSAYDVRAADDFVVPEGMTWVVDRVTVLGVYTGEAQEGDCETVQVAFRQGGSSTPGATLISYNVMPDEDRSGILTLTLPPTALSSGAHWLSVVCVGNLSMALEEGVRRWSWFLGADAVGLPAVVRNDGGGFGLTPGWKQLAALGLSPPSFSFALYGTEDGSVSVDGDGDRFTFSLSQNYPNPFSGRTRIAFETPTASPVHLAVYDALGRRVAVLVDATLPADRHTAEWNADGLASGVYLIRLQAGDQRATRRALVTN